MASYNNLGAALANQAVLAEGEERVALLGQAVEAYRAVLEVFTRQAAPTDWAKAQNSLAVLHLNRALSLEEEDKKAALQALQEAHVCVTSSLEVCTQEDIPAEHHRALQLCDMIEARMRASAASLRSEGVASQYAIRPAMW